MDTRGIARGENVGETEIHVLIVELKQDPNDFPGGAQV